MRKELMGAVLEAAGADERVVLITCDVGFGILDSFRDAFPHRFFNLGIAEGSAVSAALGLYKEGKIPFLYTIGPFWFNALEKIRLDLCYHNAHAVLIGSGSGYAYDVMGVTHWPIEDVAIYRALPNMTVFTPGDAYEAKWAVRMAHQHIGPSYIRLGRFDEKPVHLKELEIPLGKSVLVYEDTTTPEIPDLAIFSGGTALNIALDVAKKLKDIGFKASVVSMPTVKPLDRGIVVETAKRIRKIVVIEDHSVVGGLGDAIARIIAENSNLFRNPVTFRSFGLPDVYPEFGGSVSYLRETCGFTVQQMTQKILELF